MTIWDFNPEKMIKEALLDEIQTTPKPGLVDLRDNGAHKDMTPELFQISADIITPFLAKMMKTGFSWTESEEELFLHIREIGKEAECAMLRATKGVNTHKGAIFTLGILCAAAGNVYSKQGIIKTKAVLECAHKMTSQILEEELKAILSRKPHSHGEQILHEFGGKGIRGEAIDGFPMLDSAFRRFQKLQKTASSQNGIRIDLLLFIMTELYDTNVISRGGIHELEWVQNRAKQILELGGACSEKGFHSLKLMNDECIQKNVSPGGAADTLASVLLLDKFEHIKVYELDSFVTPELADGMGNYRTMNEQIKPRVTTKKIVGRAVTVKVPKAVSGFVPEAIMNAGPYDILVIAGYGEVNKSYWGGYRSLLAKKRELKGIIIDGAFRDVEDCIQEGVPVYAKGITPGSAAKDSIGELNVPIVCAGVEVFPGDYIVADQNGVIVIRPEEVTLVIERALNKRHKEENTIEEMKKSEQLFIRLIGGV